MIAKKEIEKLENSSVKLSLTIKKDAVQKEYDEILAKYTKEVQLKGFRKGKAPRSILEKKFGDGFRQEAAGNLMDNALKAAFEELEEKPLGYDYPQVQGSPELIPGEEFLFDIVYDVYPEFEVPDYKGIEIKEKQIKILKKDEDDEIETLRDQNAIVKDKENKTIAGKNIVTIDYSEVDDEGNEVTGTRREDFVFTVGSGYNYYKLDDDIKGMKLGKEKVIEKTYEDDFEVKELAGTSKKIKVKIKAIKEKILPDLDDELAQDISEDYETLDDLKAGIKKKMTGKVDSYIKEDNATQLIDALVEACDISVPKSMIKAELDNNWQNFIQRMGGAKEEQILGFLQAQGQTKEGLMESWREDAVKSVKSQLLLNKIQEDEKIEADEEDINTEIEKQAEQYNMSVEDLKKTFGENGLSQYLKSDIARRKTMDFLLDNAKKTKGDKMDFSDLPK